MFEELNGDRGSSGALDVEALLPPHLKPCPPVPPATAPEGFAEGPKPKRRLWQIPAIGLALGALAAAGFVLSGGEDGRGRASVQPPPGSASVGRVVAPDRRAADARATRATLASNPSAADESAGGKGKKKQQAGSGGGSGGTGSGGGSEPPSGGGGDSKPPLATVNLPVVGGVTVEQPEVPTLPQVELPPADVPDLPDMGVDLP